VKSKAEGNDRELFTNYFSNQMMPKYIIIIIIIITSLFIVDCIFNSTTINFQYGPLIEALFHKT